MSSEKEVQLAVWLSTPNHMFFELAVGLGFRHFVLDFEHGLFDADRTDRLVAHMRSSGLEIYAKVLGPHDTAIQQALDMGCNRVIIPHVGTVDHARRVTAAAKYPPLGRRSFAGTRTSGYANAPQEHYDAENREVLCFPMIESKEALADLEAISSLPTVDGVFAGPTDLSLSRGRGAYEFTDADRSDIERIAQASIAAGKRWIMPAWTRAEQTFAQELGASLFIVAEEIGSMQLGLERLEEDARAAIGAAGR